MTFSELPNYPIRILAVSDAGVITSFARAMRNILAQLPREHFDIHHLAVAYRGDPHNWPWKLYPADLQPNRDRTNDFFGIRRLPHLVAQIRPHIVFILNDLPILSQYAQALSPVARRVVIIMYCPIESEFVDSKHLELLQNTHYLITFTEMGRNVLKRRIEDFRTTFPNTNFPYVAAIPHGVNTTCLKPHPQGNSLESRQSAKRALWPNRPELEDSFIVLNANRNQPRKRIDLTLQSFALFARNKPSHVRLYLHMGLQDSGWDLLRLSEALEIKHRLLLSTRSDAPPEITDSHLNKVYNACDIGLNTSVSEGWGFVAFDHAATGAPQVMTETVVTRELWRDAAILIPSSAVSVDPISMGQEHYVGVEDVATALERLYSDWNYRIAMGTSAYQRATDPALKWSTIGQQWEQLFQGAVAAFNPDPQALIPQGTSQTESLPSYLNTACVSKKKLSSSDVTPSLNRLQFHQCKQSGRSKPVLLAIGEAAVPSGFARVMRCILETLYEIYDLHQLALTYRGEPHNYPWPLYPSMSQSDYFGLERVESLIQKVQPDIVLILNDLHPLGQYMQQLCPYRAHIPTVLYCPTLSGVVNPSDAVAVAGADRFVTYTDFSQRAFATAFQQVSKRLDAPPDLPTLAVIPHGVDLSNFKGTVAQQPCTIGNRITARQALWPNWSEASEGFIVLNANRNQPRKRVDTTVAGFAAFAKDKPRSVKLCLHMGLEDIGWNVLDLAKRYGVSDRLLLTHQNVALPYVDDSKLNLIYCACDVGLNTSTGEGWGLIPFEHAATGAPQVMTAHAAARELWGDSAISIEPVAQTWNPADLSVEALVSPEDVAMALEHLYADHQYYALMSEAAFKVATHPNYQWHSIGKQWQSLLSEVLKDRVENNRN